MTPARATIHAADRPAPPLSVGGLFIETLARRDFAALANSLDPSVRLLFGGPDGLEVAVATVGGPGRLYLRWRVSLRPPGPTTFSY